MITTPQGYYDLGRREGQQLYGQSSTYQQADLYKIAKQNIAAKDTKQDTAIPMVMQAQYRDGLVAGYEAARAVLLETSTRTLPVEEVHQEGQHGQSQSS